VIDKWDQKPAESHCQDICATAGGNKPKRVLTPEQKARQKTVRAARLKTPEGRALHAARQRTWYRNTSAEQKARHLVWMRAKHARLRRNRTPEQRAEQRVREATTSHAYHTRKRSAPGRHTAADLVRLCAQQGGRCAAPHCGASLTVSCTIDHKLPLSRGGSNYPDNLQLLCKSCNDSKSARTMDEWLQTRKETSNG